MNNEKNMMTKFILLQTRLYLNEFLHQYYIVESSEYIMDDYMCVHEEVIEEAGILSGPVIAIPIKNAVAETIIIDFLNAAGYIEEMELLFEFEDWQRLSLEDKE